MLFLQLRREFRWAAKVEGQATSLLSTWPDWKKKILELCKIEAKSRPLIRKLLLSCADKDFDDPSTG